MKAERKINRMWQEWNSMPAKMQKEISRTAAFIGKWQYSYSSGRGSYAQGCSMLLSRPRMRHWLCRYFACSRAKANEPSAKFCPACGSILNKEEMDRLIQDDLERRQTNT